MTGNKCQELRRYKIYCIPVPSGAAVCNRTLCTDVRCPSAAGRTGTCIPGNFHETGTGFQTGFRLPGIVPICAKRSYPWIHLYNHRIYYRYVFNTNAWTSYDSSGSYEQLLCRRYRRNLCKSGRRPPGRCDRMYRTWNFYHDSAGAAVTNAWTDWIPEHDMYRCGYRSNRFLLHDHQINYRNFLI